MYFVHIYEVTPFNLGSEEYFTQQFKASFAIFFKWQAFVGTYILQTLQDSFPDTVQRDPLLFPTFFHPAGRKVRSADPFWTSWMYN